MDFSSNIDSSEIATAIIPLGTKLEETDVGGLEKRLTIESVNGGKDFIYNQEAVDNFGWIYSVVTWDDVTTAALLKSKAEKYLSAIQFENMVIEAKAVDLHLDNSEIERFKLSDEIRVVSKPHGLDKYFRLTKMTINLNNPESSTITLGKEEKASLSAKTNQENTEIKNAIDNFSPNAILNSAIANATQLIQNSMNGYITTVTNEKGTPTELLVMDTPDKETATKVWRWNINGLGYSSTGYNGNYALAMTMEGTIVADRILSGTMYADRIKGGTLTVGGYNNDNGVIQVRNASGNVLITLDKDGITFSGDQKIKYSDISGTPTNVSDFNNDSGFINSSTSTEIARNAVRTANIVCSQLKGGTIELGGSTTTPANLKLYDSDDKVFGEWSESGIYQQGKNFKPRRHKTSGVVACVPVMGFDHINEVGYFRLYFQNVENFNAEVGLVFYMSVSGVKYKAIKFNTSQLQKAGFMYYYDIPFTDLIFPTDSTGFTHIINAIYLGYYPDTNTEYGIDIEFVRMVKLDENKQITSDYWKEFHAGTESIAEGYSLDTESGIMTFNGLEITGSGMELYGETFIRGMEEKGQSWNVNEHDASYDLDIFSLDLSGFKHRKVYGNVSSTSGAKSLYVDQYGDFISSSSSRRYKENVSYDVEKYHCEGLYDVKVAEFKYKDEFGGGDMEIGLIAEDIAEHFPQGATYNEDGTVESWSERTMIPALLKLIQEQDKRIKMLEKEVLEKCQI